MLAQTGITMDPSEVTRIFPFEARCPEESGTLRPWTAAVWVIGLMPPAALLRRSTMPVCYARRCTRARPLKSHSLNLDVAADMTIAPLIEDYWYWFWELAVRSAGQFTRAIAINKRFKRRT